MATAAGAAAAAVCLHSLPLSLSLLLASFSTAATTCRSLCKRAAGAALLPSISSIAFSLLPAAYLATLPPVAAAL